MVPNRAKHHIFYTVALVHLNATYFSDEIMTVKPNEGYGYMDMVMDTVKSGYGM